MQIKGMTIQDREISHLKSNENCGFIVFKSMKLSFYNTSSKTSNSTSNQPCSLSSTISPPTSPPLQAGLGKSHLRVNLAIAGNIPRIHYGQSLARAGLPSPILLSAYPPTSVFVAAKIGREAVI